MVMCRGERLYQNYNPHSFVNIMFVFYRVLLLLLIKH